MNESRTKFPWGRWVIISLILTLFITMIQIKPWTRTNSGIEHSVKPFMKDIQVALGYYRTEYNQWPDDPALADANTVPIKVRGPLVKALLGDNPGR